MQNVKDVFPPGLLEEYKLYCPTCNVLADDHDFEGKWVKTKEKPYEDDFKYNKPCAEGLYQYRGSIPNLFRIGGTWYFFTSRTKLIPFLVNFEIALAVENRNSVFSPKPVFVETYGDMYNFCAQHNVLDKLKVVYPAKFDSMQSKSIERSLKKMSAK